MASNNTVFVQSGFVDDGFFEALVIAPPQAPAVLNLGDYGAPVHALPFRALGGSVADLDLLYGVLGHEADLDDIQPIWGLLSVGGGIRAFGHEIPRQAILDIVIEAQATLLDVEDIVIEANPAGDNLFGYVGLTTRPMSSVRLDNSDGYWTTLVLLELILNSPAGLFVDVAHAVTVPLLTGTITGYEFDGSEVVVTYGFEVRRKLSPSYSIRD